MDNQQQNVVNPLLQRSIVPGETFDIPSRCIYYQNGEVSEKVKDSGEIHLLPMTVVDEILIKTPDKLFSGEALVEVFSRCAPDVLKPLDLLAKDVDYILMCLRKISYGGTVEIQHIHDECKHKHPKTGSPVEHTYMVDMGQFISNVKQLDPTTIDSEFTFNLSEPYGNKITVAPIRYLDYMKMMQELTLANNAEQVVVPNDIARRTLNAMSASITNVDGVTERKFIEEWISSLSPLAVKELTVGIAATNEWGMDYNYTINCVDCSEALTITGPQNPLPYFS